MSGSEPRDSAKARSPAACAELQALADRLLGQQGTPSSQQPTELLYEALLRLRAAESLQFEGGHHFRRLAARAKRRTLPEYQLT
jgi:hypothetical protein